MGADTIFGDFNMKLYTSFENNGLRSKSRPDPNGKKRYRVYNQLKPVADSFASAAILRGVERVVDVMLYAMIPPQ